MIIDRISGFVVLAVLSLYGLPTLVEQLFAIYQGQTIMGILVLSVALCVAFYILARAHMRLARFRGGRLVAQIVSEQLSLRDPVKPRKSYFFRSVLRFLPSW